MAIERPEERERGSTSDPIGSKIANDMTLAGSSLSRTVRKRLDDDCLLGDELHPSIAERLNRVRELPVQAVANLQSVDRDEQGVWLVWQFVEGCNFNEYRAQEHSPEELRRVIREARLALAAMHAHGLVHGAVHERNIIIEPNGRVRLTHVSPLLYDDPKFDFAVLELIAGSSMPEKPQAVVEREISQRQDDRQRKQAYVAAAMSLLAGIVLFAWILWYIHT